MLPEVPLLGYQISTYGIVTGIYLLLALPLTIRLNKRQGLSGTDTLTIFALAVPAAALGARLLDVVEYWGRYRSMGDLLGRRGSSIYGGLLAGSAVAWFYAESRGFSPLKLLDAGAPAMALGEAMTRIGCFLNGCCYGVPSNGPLAVVFPRQSFAFRDQVARGLVSPSSVHSLPVHPVQLYSTAVMLLVFLWLLRSWQRPHVEGETFCRFLIAYGGLRLFVAPLRMEALASMKIFSALFIVVGGFGLLSRRRLARVRSSSACS